MLCEQFYWQGCFFLSNNSTGIGLQIDNQNSVDHTMIGGSAGAGAIGIQLNGGFGGSPQIAGTTIRNTNIASSPGGQNSGWAKRFFSTRGTIFG